LSSKLSCKISSSTSPIRPCQAAPAFRDHDVDAAEVRGDFVECGDDRCGVGYVRKRPVMRWRRCVGLLARGGNIDIEQGNVRARRRKMPLQWRRQSRRRRRSRQRSARRVEVPFACRVWLVRAANIRSRTISASEIDSKRPTASAALTPSTQAFGDISGDDGIPAWKRPRPNRPRPGTRTTRGSGSVRAWCRLRVCCCARNIGDSGRPNSFARSAGNTSEVFKFAGFRRRQKPTASFWCGWCGRALITPAWLTRSKSFVPRQIQNGVAAAKIKRRAGGQAPSTVPSFSLACSAHDRRDLRERCRVARRDNSNGFCGSLAIKILGARHHLDHALVGFARSVGK